VLSLVIKELRNITMKKSLLLSAVCAGLFSLVSTSANAELITANTPNCAGINDCDDAAFLLAVATEGGSVPLDVVLNFEQDKFGNPLTTIEAVSGDIFSDAVTFSSEPGTLCGASSPDVYSIGGSDSYIGPNDNTWCGILNIVFSNPVSAVGFGTVGLSSTDSISIYDADDTLIGTFPGVSDAVFDYFGVVATAGEQISRIELDGDNFAIQDIQFNYMQGDIYMPGDINFDDQVNVADYLLLTQFVLGTGSTPIAAELSAGDMNQSGQLDAGDLVIHSRTVLGLI